MNSTPSIHTGVSDALSMPASEGTSPVFPPAPSSDLGATTPSDRESHDAETEFVDRRRKGGAPDRGERRQFGSTHLDLSEDGRELALAIDRYKVEHHRRYLTCDELLSVIRELGYER